MIAHTRNKCNLIATHIRIIVLDSLEFQQSKLIPTSFNMANEVYIVSAVRTPIGSFGGSLSSLKAHKIGCMVISEVLKRANVIANEISEFILGQDLNAGQGQNPAR